MTHPLAAMPAAAVALPRVRKAIDAVAAAAHPPLASPLPNSSLRTLRRADLPVLLPDDALWLQPGIATAERDWYALSATADGLTIVVQGDRTALVDPEMVPENWTPPTWHAPLVFRNEAIVHATFLAFGAAYSVAVECADPMGDVRCADDAFVLRVTASLRRLAVAAEVRP